MNEIMNLIVREFMQVNSIALLLKLLFRVRTRGTGSPAVTLCDVLIVNRAEKGRPWQFLFSKESLLEKDEIKVCAHFVMEMKRPGVLEARPRKIENTENTENTENRKYRKLQRDGFELYSVCLLQTSSKVFNV